MVIKLSSVKLVTVFLLLNLVCFSGIGLGHSANNLSSNNISSETTPPKIIFILDASGSMWGKVGGEEKIVSAKRVLKDAIGKLPDSAEVGLIAYGHRSKSDCQDIETLSPVKPLDKTALFKQIDALDAKGKTPITDSLRKAIDEVRALKTNETVKIVLISDGLETCEGDPCKLVREARAAGVKITLHVIGFDVGGVNYAQLECIAQAGGGSYFNAQDAEGLANALNEAIGEVKEYNSRLSVKAVADGKLTDASVSVFRAGTNESVEGGRTYESAETNPRILPLPAGNYDIKVTAVNLAGSPVREFKNVQIKEGETIEKTVDFSAGGLTVEVTRNGNLSDAAVQIFAAGTKTPVTGGRTYTSAPLNLRLNAGKYDVVITSSEISGAEPVTFKNIEVGGANAASVKHNFTSGTLRLGSKRGSELIDSTVSIIDVKTGNSIAGKRTYTNANSNPAVFELPPGNYRVRLTAVRPPGLKPKEITIIIKAGEMVEKTVDYAQ